MNSNTTEWVRIRDDESGEFYYWNTETGETTWEKPVAVKIVDSITTTATTSNTTHSNNNLNEIQQLELPPNSSSAQDKDTDSTITRAYFNSKTGRFETKPELMHSQDRHSRSTRQMNAFFDHRSWAEERGREKQQQLLLSQSSTGSSSSVPSAGATSDDGTRKPTKSELKRFKRKKKEIQLKKRAWLYK